MPRKGVTEARRAALVDAAIAEIGRAGTLDVTVGQIARRAGVSPALAHHYFGSKEALFLAAMREILADFGRAVRLRLGRARGPAERLEAIVEASFAEEQFAPEIVAAWLVFYVKAQTSPGAARLLQVYVRRLRSNLMDALVRMELPPGEAGRVAEMIGALIDGVYIRRALQPGRADRAGTQALVMACVERLLARAPHPEPAALP